MPAKKTKKVMQLQDLLGVTLDLDGHFSDQVVTAPQANAVATSFVLKHAQEQEREERERLLEELKKVPHILERCFAAIREAMTGGEFEVHIAFIPGGISLHNLGLVQKYLNDLGYTTDTSGVHHESDHYGLTIRWKEVAK